MLCIGVPLQKKSFQATFMIVLRSYLHIVSCFLQESPFKNSSGKDIFLLSVLFNESLENVNRLLPAVIYTDMYFPISSLNKIQTEMNSKRPIGCNALLRAIYF